MLLEVGSIVLCGGAAAVKAGERSARAVRQRRTGAGSVRSFGMQGAIALDLTPAARAALVDADGTHPGPGFVLSLAPGDTLSLTLSDDIAGNLLVLEVAHLETEPEARGELWVSSRSVDLYVLPPGAQIPGDFGAVTEEEMISGLGLSKLGRIDLGQTVTLIDRDSGETVLLEDNARPGTPEIVANRRVLRAWAEFV
jgi:hypothetical protein